MSTFSRADLLDYILNNSSSRHIILIDPDSQTSEEAAERCIAAVEAGSRMIFVGGSTGTDSNNVHETVSSIQKSLIFHSLNSPSPKPNFWKVPVILFPAAANAFSSAADGITFMMLMNSTSPKFLVEEQMKGAPAIKEAGVVPISMGYVVCAPGGKVGEVGKANLIQKDEIEKIKAYAICAESYGFSLLYLEAGSGAQEPVSLQLISAAKSVTDITIIVGGGIRDGESARLAIEAGADWVVTGNLTEGFSDTQELQTTLQKFITEMNS